MVKNKIKIAVLVSGSGTNLQALLDAEANGKITSGEISLVVADRQETYALKRAQSYAKKTAVVLAIAKNRENFEAELLSILAEEKIELIILAGFLNILSKDFVKQYTERIINIHPALIPSFCGKGYYGLKVHEAALNYGVKVTGGTVHYVNEIPDGGRIILQKAVDVLDNDTAQSLQKRVMEEVEWILLPIAAEKVSAELAKIKGES